MQSLKELITNIYKSQRGKSRRRGYPLPSYTKKELSEFLLNNSTFLQLYNKWVTSGCNITLRPSIDRIDDYKSYSFDNIRIVTWGENFKKYNNDKRQGVNRKQLKEVAQKTLDGNVINKYFSIAEASRQTNIKAPHISRVCRNIRKSAGNYLWEFVR